MGERSGNTRNLKMDLKVGEIPFKEYPRPQLYRDSPWKNLNGFWDCGVKVPFPLESVLSGFDKRAEYEGFVPEEYDYYTSFEYHHYGSHDGGGYKVLLHFGAVDQICNVSLDGVFVGHHEGGYLPFSFDVTKILESEGTHRLQVHVIDRLDISLPYGKQSKSPGGMWYTAVSGIWQTVWLEEVPENYIRGLHITPFPKGVRIEVDGDEDQYTVEVFEPVTGINPASLISNPEDVTDYPPSENNRGTDPGDRKKELKQICSRTFLRKKVYIEIDDPHLWSPDSPYLYGIRVSSGTDSVSSYFALRTVGIERINGQRRFLLNGEPVFFHGVLDQGYYPEGIFLPNNEKGYVNDVLYMKELGFNTIRKHIKIEPPVFYVTCDVMGMIVWQDIRVIHKDDDVILRLRDDGISFDPLERAGILDSEDKAANMGIRMVTGIAKDVSYQNLLGQNVLTLKI